MQSEAAHAVASLQVLDLDCVPSPQVVEQAPQPLHSLTSTNTKEFWSNLLKFDNNVIRNITYILLVVTKIVLVISS